jgi:uncharacterized protein (TIGR00251 family)
MIDPDDVNRWCYASERGVRVAVQVMPNARQTAVGGVFGDVLKIRIQAPATDGKANQALLDFLAAKLGLAKSSVQLLHGHTSKRKVVEIIADGLTADSATRTLLSATPG